MSKVLVEHYREFNIYFDSWSDLVEAVSLDEKVSIKPSPEKKESATEQIKAKIDAYYLRNNTFKPVKVIRSPEARNSLLGEVITLVGVRKDGRFMTLNSKGEKGQLSEYDEKNWMQVLEKNWDILRKISDLQEKKMKLELEERELKALIVVKPISVYRDEFLGKTPKEENE